MKRSFWIFFFSLCPLFELKAYVFLSEFINSSRTEIRETLSSVTSTDLIADPKWANSAMPLQLELCVGGTGIAKTSFLIATPANRNAELLSDAEEAVAAWSSAAAGTELSLSPTVNLRDDCGPNEGEAYGGNVGESAGRIQIFFNNVLDAPVDNPEELGTGIIAFAILSLALVGGELRIVDADIVFNSGLAAGLFVTQAWIDAQGGSLNTAHSSRYSFLGVLTHELGHLLGLGHSLVIDRDESQNTNQVTMFPAVSSLGQTQSLESLERDDRVGLKVLYEEEATFATAEYKGSIGGQVTYAGNRRQRGAQVVAYSLNSNETLAASLSGMTGDPLNPSGDYEIKGLPLNEPFIVFVEPPNRTEIHPNFIFTTINSPLILALSSQLAGINQFAVEAYPDADVADVRSTGSLSSEPGLSGVEQVTLNNLVGHREGLNFFINGLLAPNDELSTLTAEILSSSDSSTSGLLNVGANDDLRTRLQWASNLNRLSNPDIQARLFDSSGFFAADLITPDFSSLQSSEALINFGAPEQSLSAEEIYTLRVTLFSGNSQVIQSSRSVQFASDWNGVASLSQGGGGGGCHIRAATSALMAFLWIFVLSLAGLVALRKSTG